MGVDYHAVLAIGKEFDYKGEAKDFCEEHLTITKEDEDEFEDEFSDWLDNFGGGCLNSYTGNDWYVGFSISVHDPEAFQKSFDEAMENWNKYFPNVEPSVLHTVMIY